VTLSETDTQLMAISPEEAGITPATTLTQILKGRTPSIKTATALARAANKLTGLDTYNTITFLHLND
jgi:hypothetical protein